MIAWQTISLKRKNGSYEARIQPPPFEKTNAGPSVVVTPA
jgi:hypothetical protein